MSGIRGRRSLLIKADISTIQLNMNKNIQSKIDVRPTNPFCEFNKEEIERSVPERFEIIASQYPDDLAVKSKNYQLTYDELNRAANRVARAILNSGCEDEKPVALLLKHDTPLIVAMLGVLKAGKIYLPLDASFPAPRIKAMLEDAQAGLIVTNDEVVSVANESAQGKINGLNIEHLDSSIPDTNLGLSLLPDTPACILYTSGTTGRPKGVIHGHRTMLHAVMLATNDFHLSAQDRVALLLSCSVSVSIRFIFGALLNGASLWLFDTKDEGLSRLAAWLTQANITICGFVATTFRQFAGALTEGQVCPALRLICIGSESVSQQDVEVYRKHFADHCILVIKYAANETGTIRNLFLAKSTQVEGSVVAVGHAVEDKVVLLLDERGKPVGFDSIGEIAVKSRYLSAGYWRRPDLTDAKFLPDPNGGDDRIYLTGDLGRMTPDGCLFHLGRNDLTVKIRGYRVETAEIEMALLDHPNIKQVAVVAREERDGDARLVAYLVPQNLPSPNSSELRSILQGNFPDYMIPSAFVLLDALPLTPNGKVDRHNLPHPGRSRPELDTPYRAPTNSVEEKLANIWTDVLSLDQVGIDDNFFALGGHSLLATQVISRIRDVFQVELPLRRLFETPTVAALVDCIEKNHRVTSRDELQFIRPVSRNGALPLSFAQQRLWFLNRLEPENPAYNQPTVLRLSGDLNIEALQKTLDAIVARHDVLRTTFTAIDEKPMQVVNEPRPVELPLIDLSERPALQRETEVQELFRVLTRQCFNLAEDLMLRGALLRLGVNDHVLFLVTHHIASDNWSDQILFREIAAFYEAFADERSPVLSDLPIQYADFASWQRQWLQGEVFDEELTYWKKQLKGSAPVLELPTDRPRPLVQTHQGAQRSIKLAAKLCQKLKELSREQDATLFMILLAAFQTLLYRYTGQDDIIVGSPIANRGRTEVEELLGFFINTLVLRTDFSGNPTFQELLARVRENCLQAYAHQDLPFERIVEELQPDRDLSRNPLFEVMFELRKSRNQTAKPGGMKVEELEFDSGLAKFDLTLYMIEEGETLRGLLEYRTDLFDPATIERMLGHFERLLEGIVAHPKKRVSDLPLLTAAERHQHMVEWNDTDREYPSDKCLHHLFEAQVERTPEGVALVYEDQQLTYLELNRRANRLANYLQKLGVGPEILVAICFDRSLEMVVGLLGVLKAGGAYVPVDSTYPKERQGFMLRDADVRVLLTQKKFLNGINHPNVVSLDRDWQEISSESDDNPASRATPENLAYVIYTSGSTGTPKGILGLHRGAVNRLNWMWNAYPFNAKEIACLKTSLTFVDSVCEILGALLQGIPSVIIPDETLMNPHRLIQILSDFHITRIVLVPSFLRVLLYACPDLQRELPELRIWITSGEILPADLVLAFQEIMPRSTLINLYGSTEVAADVTCHEVRNNGPLKPVPIGLPIANTQVYILDRYLNPVPIGIPGELHVGEASLARGYLNHLELTAEKFIPHPFSTEPGARLYKTGDLARRVADGNIEFLGRLDTQVKIRGLRIELGEIEAVLGQHPAVYQNAVVLREDEDPIPGKFLVAYVVPRQGQTADIAELRGFLRTKLPDYMVPSAFEFLDALPLTTNGKLDRKALPAPNHTQPDSNRIFIAPRTANEEAVAEIWSSVLGFEKVGIQDNFFDLGGHSILAIQIMLRLSDRFRTLLPLRMLFEKPNVEELALEITKTLIERADQAKLRRSLSELESMSDEDAKSMLGAPPAIER